MRFWEHVPNSLKNKNMERLIPYLQYSHFYFFKENEEEIS
jgi:hypothetical protein